MCFSCTSRSYYESSWLYAIDLGTGEVKKQRLPDGRQFYLSGTALAFDGKFYMTTPGQRHVHAHVRSRDEHFRGQGLYPPQHRRRGATDCLRT